MAEGHRVLPKRVAVALRDRVGQRDELDGEVAVAFLGVQDAVAADGTTYHGVAYLVATNLWETLELEEDLVSEEVLKVASELESVSLRTRLVSTWLSKLTCSAGVYWNFPTILVVAVDGMMKGKDYWACAMVNCYLVTCEVVDQTKVVAATGAAMDGTTTEVLR